MDGRSVGLFLVFVGILGLYLEATRTLGPTLTAIIEPSDKGPTLAQFAIASFVLIIVSSFLDTKSQGILYGVVLLGALYVDRSKNGDDNLISQLIPK